MIKYISQLSGYDVLTHHAVRCIIVGKTSLYFIHISSYKIVDMTVSNGNLYAVLVRASSYFRV
jgi:hypothetical protein